MHRYCVKMKVGYQFSLFTEQTHGGRSRRTHNRERYVSNQKYASAVRNATFTGDDNTKAPGNRGVKVTLDVTAVPGTDTVQLVIEEKDAVSGKYVQVLAAVARVATGTDQIVVYPGVTETANVDTSNVLPDIYRVRVLHSAGSNFTYSIGVVELP